MEIKRGDIYLADLNPVVGSEQGGSRPVLVIQNDIGNRYSPTVIVAAITAQLEKAKLPTHVVLKDEANGLPKTSVVLLEQIRTLDKKRLLQKIGMVNDSVLKQLDEALIISLGLLSFVTKRGGQHET